MLNRGYLMILCMGLASVSCWPVSAADAVVAPDKGDDSPVVAEVNGQKIHAAEVESLFASVVPEEQQALLDAQGLATLEAQTLAQLIDRRLVEAALSSATGAPTAKDIDAAVENFKLQLESQHKKLDEVMSQRHLSMALLREQLAWQVLWERTVAKYLTSKVLEDYFSTHQRQFDGSEVRASHILFRPAGRQDAAAIAKLVEEASALRAKIVAGDLTFAEAAEKYSAGPSREQGGDVGFFPRNGVMGEAFSQAAFGLEKGQISQPIVSPFGVHLITVTDVKPGTKKLGDVVEQIKTPAAKAMFDKLATRERAKAKIEFTDAWPHFNPGTHELVIPTAAGQ
jgi:parvulin-like peptidyl-prolyl isomerase